ncbi:MAG: CDP-alcohol phosphatidyltransferase family protein [Rhabdochlamydiaceae bacterium]|nr:CDP-alcohol phosphatidyltransferase family protein [Rhabdochlamydiaceae bacterium]
MRKIHLIPNMITAFGLACGLFVIFKLNMVEPGFSTYEVLYSSVVLLLLAAFADLLDGAIARIMNAESEFGFMFDSLADAISFGVAPSILMLKNLSLEQGSGLSFFAVIGAMLFSLCGVLRLVRFNVKVSEAKGKTHILADQKKHFTGLPIPAAALAAVSLNLLLESPFVMIHYPTSPEAKAIILTIAMVVLGFFMISRWKFPSLKVLHFRLPSFHLVLLTVILALFILYGIFYFFSVILMVITWGYIVLGWILSIIRLIAGKKSKTLEDFEPDLED